MRIRAVCTSTIVATAILAVATTTFSTEARNLIVLDAPTSSASPPAWALPSRGTANVDPEWEQQSLPIGNGSIGGNVLGSIARERITLNEKSLWMGGPSADSLYWGMNKRVEPGVIDKARQALLRGDTSEADSIMKNNFIGTTPYNSSSFGHFTTFGEVSVETGIDETKVSNYRRQLDVDSSLVSVSFDYDGVKHIREFFASYPDSVMVWRFSSPGKPRRLTLKFSTPHEIITATRSKVNGLLVEGRLADNGMLWSGRVEAIAKPSGQVHVDTANTSISVDGADDIIFLFAADTDYQMNDEPEFANPQTYTGPHPTPNVNAVTDNALSLGYSNLRQRHINDYQRLYNRVHLSLGDDRKLDDTPTPQRLAAYRDGMADNALEELLFNFGRYLLISSSRSGNLPANLQGMWHNNIDGPWHVDYHNNINLQMNYWPATVCNLPECFKPFSDFVKSLRKPGEITANSYFGTEGGWTASISANPFGFSAPLSDKEMSWNYIPTAGAWLATQLWDYYLFTQDNKWLNDTAFPIIKSSADFSADILFNNNRTYTSAPSYSPEHGTADLGATYANAVTREILVNAISASEILGTDSIKRIRWAGILDSIAPFHIGRHGQLQEWWSDIDNPKDTHRHTNHLFGVHPGSSILATDQPELAQAARTTLAQRGTQSTGWAMSWRINLYARLLDGDGAHQLLRNLLSTGVADNLWDLHPPFQIDGNFGATAGIAEMLLQSQGGRLHLLPALPATWPDGSVNGLRARGNFLVDISFANGELLSATIISLSGNRCAILYRDQTASFPTAPNATYRITPTPSGLKVEQTMRKTEHCLSD